MSLRPCLRCGELTPEGSYCPQHEPKRASRSTPGRGSGSAAGKLREAALKRDGGQCRALLADGTRCAVDDPRLLQAHHLRPLRLGGSNGLANVVMLCRKHHEQAEREAWGRRSPCERT